MIVDRRMWTVKHGCMQEAVAFLKSFLEGSGLTLRVYTSRVGPDDTVVAETEHESLAEMESFYKEWFGRPDIPALAEKWNAVTEAGGTREIWDLE